MSGASGAVRCVTAVLNVDHAFFSCDGAKVLLSGGTQAQGGRGSDNRHGDSKKISLDQPVLLQDGLCVKNQKLSAQYGICSFHSHAGISVHLSFYANKYGINHPMTLRTTTAPCTCWLLAKLNDR